MGVLVASYIAKFMCHTFICISAPPPCLFSEYSVTTNLDESDSGSRVPSDGDSGAFSAVAESEATSLMLHNSEDGAQSASSMGDSFQSGRLYIVPQSSLVCMVLHHYRPSIYSNC